MRKAPSAHTRDMYRDRSFFGRRMSKDGSAGDPIARKSRARRDRRPSHASSWRIVRFAGRSRPLNSRPRLDILFQSVAYFARVITQSRATSNRRRQRRLYHEAARCRGGFWCLTRACPQLSKMTAAAN